MTVQSFSGGAGCGKTYQLMRALEQWLQNTPLREGQKVLALTFMHGSRRRLAERLGSMPAVSRRHECLTLDSFAWRLVRRWVSMAELHGFVGLQPDQYDRVIEAAGLLLENVIVARWVSATFPVLIVDEAQDLSAGRLRIITFLASHSMVIAAADEFQCLDEQLRPNPACAWLTVTGILTNLEQPRRTEVQDLLAAAAALRAGAAPESRKNFQIRTAPNAPLAGTFLSNEIGWYGRSRSVAVISPTDGIYAHQVIDWVAQRTTKQGNGPFAIPWEQSESRTAEAYLEALQLDEESDISLLRATFEAGGNPRVEADVLRWMDTQRKTQGRTTFPREEIVRTIKKSFSDSRRYQGTNERLAAMTIHGAKNREFDLVIVLWPAAIRGSSEQKRRLLYNAVTRARHRCIVLVQSPALLQASPFV
ncbi:ATP-dependent helicase [uncultured Pseudomonas sp.]|uniref:ATP-dependent helicase n=1 Tax=uncultured Pseudomonas sp. TaxID=114707 RepID=UPI0026265E3C|nr:ATP-dependent helicase [uncultured Pseudomonas sp.]